MSLTWKQRSSAVLGNAMEFYDIAVFASISIYISDLFASQGVDGAVTVVWAIFALRFLVRPLGGVLIGRYADKVGRKKALIFCNALTGVATVAMAFVPVSIVGEYVVLVFLLFQMVQAFSFGGEYPTLISYLLHDAKPSERSKISSLIVASSIIGVILSLLIVAGLKMTLTDAQMHDWGWRIPLLVGVVNILISLYFRLSLPELPRNTSNETSSKSMEGIVRVFCISILGAVVFYVQNLASGILGKSLNIENLPLINSTMLVLLLGVVAYLTDRGPGPEKTFKMGSMMILLCAVPLFMMLGSGVTVLQFIAVLGISLLSAMILGNLAALLWLQVPNQTASLGIGYNIALSIFGGLTPLIVTKVMDFGSMYVGVYIAVATLPALFILTQKTKSQLHQNLSS
ncbi:MFS transporter [Vibrio sp. Of7-15]|uniref:MFS transporter n=1 Tax=Vibrio sp. Of7-15 TaxID=2724879 RepID=UPI001EF279EC|nr:MFS transporter [Vibrio sp. Of7-15]MCG7499633.1 MFS transporter [Vibrio sp. Of7-15]